MHDLGHLAVHADDAFAGILRPAEGLNVNDYERCGLMLAGFGGAAVIIRGYRR
jgi:hypothetical protein